MVDTIDIVDLLYEAATEIYNHTDRNNVVHQRLLKMAKGIQKYGIASTKTPGAATDRRTNAGTRKGSPERPDVLQDDATGTPDY